MPRNLLIHVKLLPQPNSPAAWKASTEDHFLITPHGSSIKKLIKKIKTNNKIKRHRLIDYKMSPPYLEDRHNFLLNMLTLYVFSEVQQTCKFRVRSASCQEKIINKDISGQKTFHRDSIRNDR